MTTNQKTNIEPICLASHAPKPRPEWANGCCKPPVDPVVATLGNAVPGGFAIGLILGVPIAAMICGWQDAVMNCVMMMLGASGLWISQKL